ncbi:MAG: ABC transporter permease, partial [Oscillospiraceae bacterium]|nr:ABC transporter permease [Oscillospiraceae bacterium]
MKSFSGIFLMGSKYLWRRKLNVCIFIGAPLLFILILGTALSSYISPDTDFEPIPVACVTDNEESMLSEFLKSNEISRFLETEFTDEKQAREMLAEITVLIVVFEQNGEISVLKPNIVTTDASVALSIIESYKKTAAAAEIAIANGANPLEIMQKINNDFSVESKPIGKRVPTATDYYAVTMLVY